MATASAAAGAGHDVWLVRLAVVVVVICGQVALVGHYRETMVRAHCLRRGGRYLCRRRRDVGLAPRDNGPFDRDMDRTALPDTVRIGGCRRGSSSRRQNGMLPARIDVERELSRRRTLGELPRTGHRRGRVRTDRALILIISRASDKCATVMHRVL